MTLGDMVTPPLRFCTLLLNVNFQNQNTHKGEKTLSIICDQFNTIYCGGRKGRQFEIRFCPRNVKAPWSIHGKRTNGYYFTTLREALSFAAGRGYIEPHMIDNYQHEIMAALDSKLND